jgi:hypothetical protein
MKNFNIREIPLEEISGESIPVMHIEENVADMMTLLCCLKGKKIE